MMTDSIYLKKNNNLVLIVSDQLRTRESLEIALSTIADIGSPFQASDKSSALKFIVHHIPRLVILDADLPDNEVWSLLEMIKQESPESWCLVLAGSIHHQITAQAKGADVALLKGFQMEEFLKMVTIALIPLAESDDHEAHKSNTQDFINLNSRFYHKDD